MTYKNAHNADEIKAEVQRIIDGYRAKIRYARQHSLSGKRLAEVESLGLAWALPADTANGDAQAVIDAASPRTINSWTGEDYDVQTVTSRLYDLVNTPAPAADDDTDDDTTENEEIKAIEIVFGMRSDGLHNALWAFKDAAGHIIASGAGPCDVTLRLNTGEEYTEVFTASNAANVRTTTERTFTVTSTGRIQWQPVPGHIEEAWADDVPTEITE